MENGQGPVTSQPLPVVKNNTTKIVVIVAVVVVVLGVGVYLLNKYGVLRRTFNPESLKTHPAVPFETDAEADQQTFTEWPSTMPAVVPEFKNGTLSEALSAKPNDKDVWSIYYVDVADDAAQAYSRTLAAAGWSSTDVTSTDKGEEDAPLIVMETINAENDQYYLTLTVDVGTQTATLGVSAK